MLIPRGDAPGSGRAFWPIAAGIVLGSLALWLAFRGLDLTGLTTSLSRINYAWTLAALASTGASLLAVAWRWQLLFHPDHTERHLATLFRAVVVGQMLNIVVPLRLGEVARMYMVAEQEGLSKARVLATLAVEKALDLAMFALALVVVLAMFAFPGGVQVQQRALWVVGLGGTLGLWFLSRHSERLHPMVRWGAKVLPVRLRPRAAGIVDRFLDGLSALRSTGASFAAIALSVVIVAIASLTNYLVFLAFGFHLSFLAGLFLLVLIQVGSVPPSLPGKIGIFHYLTMVGLGVFGVAREPALSYAIVLYAVALLPKVLLGAVFMATGGTGGWRKDRAVDSHESVVSSRPRA
ncbi:MAG: flippase-like domain-containing protein [Acidobacteria bacterium]|nr:flippase-like domain-containing protein [Acidobacteriota bacterium]